ncbi:hypothetical protein AKJ64_03280 [candidate division MSBL1 archaeon SCGC-AAA259E17]|uniref:UspA domain-containing protein n=1 Tax=candidate division MSBL1 archaeon SCGC-AAA259E17 TaxID=1698263 RepID=A0A133UE65_9EURY|nr:hypothetical protein AKJ64_03280 [candidate division MSBL1 archaeon SCGC-AAA259E17]
MLIPLFGIHPPEKAYRKALKCLKKDGKLYLLHVLDDASTRSVRYMTELGEVSEVVKSFQRAQRDLRKGETEEFVEEAEEETEKGVSMETKFVKGAPVEEVLKAIEEYSIDRVVLEQLRQKKDRILLGDELDILRKKAPCQVITVP